MMLTVLLTAVLAVAPGVPAPDAGTHPFADPCVDANAKLELSFIDTDLQHLGETLSRILCKPVVFPSEISGLKFSVFAPLPALSVAQSAKVLFAAMQTAGIDVTEKDGIVMLTKHVSK